MSWITRLLGLERSAVVDLAMRSSDMPPGLVPPRRGALGTVDEALSLGAAYRAIALLATSTSQLPIIVERGGLVLPADEVPSLVRAPSLTTGRDEWIELAVTSLATTGELFVLNDRGLQLRILAPHEVGLHYDDATGAVTYVWRGRRYARPDILHERLLPLAGRLRGLGPIEAARLDIKTALDTRGAAARWFDGGGEPAGILSTSSPLTAEQARVYRQQWNESAAAVDNPTGIRVLGGGFSYQSMHINPKDAQWLESQKFSTVQVARLFGVPASLMLAAPEGNVQTYANVEQEWTAYVRFTLMQYIRRIENVLTAATPRGQRVKFSIEGLLRADTGARYAAYSAAIFAGWLTPDEVRAIEGRPALTPDQVKQLEAAPNGTNQKTV